MSAASDAPASRTSAAGGSIPPFPLVFIHGAGAVGQIWQHQLLAFPGAVAPDLPGHPAGAGLSTVAEMASWLLDALTTPAGGRPVRGADRRWIVAGHSLGGAVAIEAALAAPERFGGVILIATGARLRVRQEFFDLLAADYDAAVEELLRWWFAADASPRVVARARDALRTASPAVVHDDFWAAHHFDAMDRVGRIALPALIICGQEDRMTPVRYSEYLHAQIAGSQLVVIPRAGHMVMLEQPRAVNDAIGAFLRGLR